MKKIWLLSLLLILSAQTFAQDQNISNIDSAKKILQSLKEDTAKVNLLNNISGYYGQSNMDSALVYATQQYDLAQKLNYAKGLAKAYYHLSSCNSALGNGAQTLEYAYKMLPIAEQLKDSVQLGVAYSAIASGYSKLNDYKQGLQWQKKAYGAVAFLSDSVNKAGQLYNLGHAYLDANLPDSAFLSFQQSYRMFNSIKDKKYLLFPLLGLVKVNFALGKPDEGKMYSQQLISLAKSTGSTDFLGSAYYALAEQYLKENKKDSALYYARKAVAIAKSLNARSGLGDVYNVLAKTFELSHQPDSALKYTAQIVQIKDSFEAENNRSQLKSIAFKQKMEEKEKADAEQKTRAAYEHQQSRLRNQLIIFSLLAALIVFGIIAVMLYRNNAQKQKANKLLEKQKEQIQDTLGELKSTQAQLIQSEKMASLGELTAGIAHEIQNPLNFVNNFSEVNKELIEEVESERAKKNGARDEALEAELLRDVKENTEKIIHHGKRADSIVKGMLQHSRASTGKKELTDINALVDESLRLSYHGLRAKDKEFNATINTNFDESIGKINIVPQDISRVMLNLFNNAFYAVHEKKAKLNGTYEPAVSVCTKRGDGKIEIQVKDNGSGIPQNITDKIFQPFFTTKPTGQGTGLGLSLSYDIIKAHGGKIKVESREGEGSDFIIQLLV